MKQKTEIDEAQVIEDSTSKVVHDNKNKLQAHLLKVQIQAKRLDTTIQKANTESVKLQDMLSITEQVWAGAGGQIKKTK